MFKKILLILLIISQSVMVYAEPLTFTDVSEEAWYFEEIEYATSRSFISGYGNGQFKPEQEITILEALHITLKVLGHQQPESVDWIIWTEEISAKLNLIMPLEYTDLNQPILRKEMILIALRAIDLPLEDDYMKVSQEILDLNEVSYYWQQIVIKGYAHGIISGYGDGYVKAESTMTRAEGVTIINRIFKKL